MRNFQFDLAKSQSNREKHGIDFDQAKVLWDDPDLVRISARSEDESRTMIIARFAGQFWSAIVTDRDDEIRIISVRRSRPREIEIYES
jgi:uncharacterized DUF497 family protein